MAKCAACGTFILFGGERDGELRYCNAACRAEDVYRQIADALPDDLIEERVAGVHQGDCPKCNGPGPVDVHVSHTAWSALVMTGWASKVHLSCRGCARKSQAWAALQTGVIGWWGFPWGLIMTPVQIGRNLVGMVSGPNPLEPSEQLVKIIRRGTAQQVVERRGGDSESD